MVSKLFDAQQDKAQNVNDFDIYLSAAANIAVGSDTTSISLSSVLLFLFRSLDCLRKVREELEGSHLKERPSFKDVQILPYLQAVIKEALRIHPAVGLPLFRAVPKGGVVMAGHFSSEKVGMLECLQ
jgi:cytochrome P450